MAWLYRSSFAVGSRLIPKVVSSTTPSIGAIVAAPNTPATNAAPARLPLAAGYIRSGISGSQGPNTKMMNKTQGVAFLVPGDLWKCRWSPLWT